MLVIDSVREIFGMDAENRSEWSGRLSKTGSRHMDYIIYISIAYILLAKKDQL